MSSNLISSGTTAREKLHHLNAVDDSLRRFLCFEPRGCAQMIVNLVWPSSDPEANAGFLILQAERAHARFSRTDGSSSWGRSFTTLRSMIRSIR